MKLNRIFPLLLIFLGLIPSCCPEVDPFFIPGSLEAEVMLDKVVYSDIEDAEITSAESLEIWLSFDELQYVAESRSDFALQNSCHALTQCPDEGHSGLKSGVSSIEIKSSAEFQEMTAGEDISQFFHVLEFLERDDEDNIIYTEKSVNETFEDFDFLTYSESYVKLNFSELPENNLAHTFTVELTFEDGTFLSNSSVVVQF